MFKLDDNTPLKSSFVPGIVFLLSQNLVVPVSSEFRQRWRPTSYNSVSASDVEIEVNSHIQAELKSPPPSSPEVFFSSLSLNRALQVGSPRAVDEVGAPCLIRNKTYASGRRTWLWPTLEAVPAQLRHDNFSNHRAISQYTHGLSDAQELLVRKLDSRFQGFVTSCNS